jgi:hypothetical protein
LSGVSRLRAAISPETTRRARADTAPPLSFEIDDALGALAAEKPLDVGQAGGTIELARAVGTAAGMGREQMDYFNDQPVAFWHMQSDFVRYLSFGYARKQAGLHGRNVSLLETRSVQTFIWKIWQCMSGKLDRRKVYRHYFEESDFSDIFSSSGFWKEDVFV